ncbi:hypothetical protein HFN69_21935 [Rhizobium laguerreae]|uniref:hypothetical protein n=1 Tax=Rhizobium laguerreae TaxID=1076926 RepID=UPI001C911F31|nr:hypothetical protein [Rhizobium laguerreae]MBY3544782.1 hypothetical protein [Rhizobium laguerreae]MBY3549239.1 hypothetical protein [Rhizobium laguerreae]
MAKLAEDTFLDLWSWPNVFKKPGKELCDLLVVCGDDVIMFSDKHNAWPDDPLELAWKRWYNRAIKESADQIRKAELWLRRNPKAVFADAKCQQPVPLELPPIQQRRVHGICVATGAEAAASRHFRDPDGTFMILPSLRGTDHVDFSIPHHQPFCIGDVDPAGPFIHVFNMATLEIVMSEFDTITDFTQYLNARADLIRSGRLTLSPSEPEMVANYLLTTDPNGEHRFPKLSDVKAAKIDPDTKISFAQGEYYYLVQSPEYARRVSANWISYEWDRLIGFFTHGVLNDSQYRILDTDPTIELAERGLRIMAREDRLKRRMLGAAIVGAREALEVRQVGRLARIATTYDRSTGEKIAYVFLVLKGAGEMAPDAYRRVRAAMLETYCLATLHDDRDLSLCVGIAVMAISDSGESEDLVALPQQNWTEEMAAQLRLDRESFEILLQPVEMKSAPVSAQIFPPDPTFDGMSRQQRRALERQRAKQQRSQW